MFQEKQNLIISIVIIQNESNQKLASYIISKTKQLRFWGSQYGNSVFPFLPELKTKPLTEMLCANLQNQGCYYITDTQFCLIF